MSAAAAPTAAALPLGQRAGPASPVAAAAVKPIQPADIIPLDRISVVALFAIYPLLEEGTRFGIKGNYLEIQTPSAFTYTVPGLKKELKLQGAYRWWWDDSREEIVSFCEPIEDAMSWYGNDPEFRNILKLTAEGLNRYGSLYKKKCLATQTIERTLEHIQAFERKQEVAPPSVPPAQLKKIYDELKKRWLADEIALLARMILLADAKKKQDRNPAPEVEAIKRYIEEKQKECVELLAQEQALLIKPPQKL